MRLIYSKKYSLIFQNSLTFAIITETGAINEFIFFLVIPCNTCRIKHVWWSMLTVMVGEMKTKTIRYIMVYRQNETACIFVQFSEVNVEILFRHNLGLWLIVNFRTTKKHTTKKSFGCITTITSQLKWMLMMAAINTMIRTFVGVDNTATIASTQIYVLALLLKANWTGLVDC